MIEFTPDGPFAEKADPLFPGRVRVVGLGQTGVAVCDQIVLHGRPLQDIWVFDTDQQAIEGSIVPVSNRHLLGRNLVRGLGCSGDLELAREIVAAEEARLATIANGCDFLILLLGLGGSTGVALAEHLTGLGRKAGAKVIIIGVQPFAFEGCSRREKSVSAIADLRREADSVLVLAHDRLAEHPAAVKNIRHGFHLMHQLMAQTAQALAQVVCKRGLIQLSFADVRSLYARYNGTEVLENCWAAHVEGDIHDCIEDLVRRLLESPLLNDESIWKLADHAIVAVSGACDLGLSDVQELVGALKDHLPVKIPIATSASLDDEDHEKLRMTVLLATTAPMPFEAPAIPAPEPLATRKPKPVAETVSLAGLKEALKPAEEPVPEAAASAKKMTPPTPTPAALKKTKPAQAPAPKPMEPPPVLEEEEKPAEAGIMAETGHLPSLATMPPRRHIAKQEELHFESATRGRFEKTHETMYRGENLDQPTFRRRGITIKI
jgi:cell division protein FtsZ